MQKILRWIHATLIFAEVAGGFVQAAFEPTWQHRISGPTVSAIDVPVDVAYDPAGNVVVTGTSLNRNGAVDGERDIVTLKYVAASGELLWSRRFKGAAGLDDEVRSLAIDSLGNVIVAGSSETFPLCPSCASSLYVAKYRAADGQVIWERELSGGRSGRNQANSVAVDRDDNVLVAGALVTEVGTVIYTAKLDRIGGNVLWDRRVKLNAFDSDSAVAVAVGSSGDVVVAGTSYDGDTHAGYIAKYAGQDGTSRWERSHGAGQDSVYFRRLALDPEGNPIVVGYFHWDDLDADDDFYTVKFAAQDGAVVWRRFYNSPSGSQDRASGVAVDARGNVLVAGVLAAGEGYVVKYAAQQGISLWERRFVVPFAGRAVSLDVVVDPAGDPVVAGSHSGAGEFAAKLASLDGRIIWEAPAGSGKPASFDSPSVAVALDGLGNIVTTASGYGEGGNLGIRTIQRDEATGAVIWNMNHVSIADASAEGEIVARAPDGNILVAGNTWSPGRSEYYVAKLAQTNGAVIWRRQGPAGVFFSARALVVDPRGEVILTGISASTYGGWDPSVVALTIRLAGRDGTVLWQHRNPRLSREHPVVLAVDGQGDVISAGASPAPDGFDIYVSKHASLDGRLVWERTIDDLGSGIDAGRKDHARALLATKAGDVIVAGGLDNGTPNYGLDVYTAKLAADDGRLLWDQRYNSPANLDDYAQRLALDSSENVIVAGLSNNDELYADFDVYTAKHSAGDGRILWSQRYNTPVNHFENIGDLMLAEDGSVIVSGMSTPFDRHGGHLKTVSSLFTLNYGAEDGTLRWIQSYTSEDVRQPALQELAFDSFGRVRLVSSLPSLDGVGPWGLLALSYDEHGNQIAVERASGPEIRALPPRSLLLEPSGAATLVGAAAGDLMAVHYGLPSPPASGLPRIVKPPASRVLSPGSPVSFEVSAEGVGPLGYQWRYQGMALAGKTNSALVLSDVQEVHAGGYSVEVSNAAGAVVSPEAQLYQPVMISSLTLETSGLLGQPAYFRVQADGTAPYTYQWFLNGTPLPGATLRYLAIEALQATNAGLYSVEVRGLSGSVVSSNIPLSTDPIRILQVPGDTTVAEGAPVLFSVRALSARPIHFQWQRNGLNIHDATNSSLVFPSGTLSDEADYRVIVATDIATFTSSIARLTVIPAQPIDRWTPRASGIDSDLYAITYAHDVFVVVGDSGTILTSRDGMHWVTQASGSTSRLHGVAYGAGRFVAVGRDGTILTSTNGSHWVTQASGTFEYLKEVAYGGNQYVAVGESATLLTSSDGRVWSPVNLGTLEDLTGVTFVDGRFIVVGEGKVNDEASIILTSLDGKTWEASRAGTGKNLRAVSNGAQQIVAVGNDGTILSSVDAITWELAGSRLCIDANFRDVLYGNGLWVAVGNTSAGLDAVLASSFDGRHWTCRPSSTPENLHSITYGQGRFVAVGNAGVIVQSIDFTSSVLSARHSPDREGVELVVWGEVGRAYRVQSSEDPTGGNWFDLFQFANYHSASTVVLDSAAGGVRQRFFRVVSP